MRFNFFQFRQPQDYTLRNCEVICSVSLCGTYALTTAILTLLGISYATEPTLQTAYLALLCVGALAYVIVAHWLKRTGNHVATAYMIVAFYLSLACGIIFEWGINLPIGTLLLGLVIVLAGILLTALHALIVALIASFWVLAMQGLFLFGWHTPNLSWTGNRPTMGEAVAYSAVFSMLALVSWLYNREMERSLIKSRRAEKSLRHQKATLEKRVQERTKELRKTQLEEMRQMYRFTEIGQLGAMLLHDLANHLTALTLEIEGLDSKAQSKNIAQARRIIAYLDDVIDNTRSRLYGSTREQSFDVATKVSEVISILRHKAAKSGVRIDWEPPHRPQRIVGDSASLNQVMTILINNAVEAYSKSSAAKEPIKHPKVVEVSIEWRPKQAIIRVRDRGRGISASERRQLFKPFHSTKKSGLGLGLYIAEQSIKGHFRGTLSLSPAKDCTEFVIKLPLKS